MSEKREDSPKPTVVARQNGIENQDRPPTKYPFMALIERALTKVEMKEMSSVDEDKRRRIHSFIHSSLLTTTCRQLRHTHASGLAAIPF